MIDFEQTAYALYFIGTYFSGISKRSMTKFKYRTTRKAFIQIGIVGDIGQLFTGKGASLKLIPSYRISPS